MLAEVIGFCALPICFDHMDTIIHHVRMQQQYRLQAMLDLDQPAPSIDLSKPIESAIAYITHHISERLTLHSVSRQVYLSPSHFSRLFAQKVGINFNDYILAQRIEAAKVLLAETHLPIELISTKAGFNSASYFSQTFKRLTGRTPRIYRSSSVGLAEPINEALQVPQ